MAQRVRVIGRVRPSIEDDLNSSSNANSLSSSPNPNSNSNSNSNSNPNNSNSLANPLPLSFSVPEATITIQKPYCRAKTFKFDRVLPAGCTQGQVYDAAINVPNMIEEVFKGLSGGVLCYGQTGAGKTFTMFGDMGNNVVCESPPPPLDTATLTAHELLATPTRKSRNKPKSSLRSSGTKKKLNSFCDVMCGGSVMGPPNVNVNVNVNVKMSPNINIMNMSTSQNTPSNRNSVIKHSYVPNSQHKITLRPPNRPPPPPPGSTTSTHRNNVTKKHTAPPNQAGIIPRTVRALFSVAERYKGQNDRVSLIFSFVQVYNETVSDLLQPGEAKCLSIRESPEVGVFIPDATQVIATSTKGVLAVLRAAAQHRTTRSTKQNSTSSRSHAILRFGITRSTPNTSSTEMKVRRSTLTFVDLAGSERITKVGNSAGMQKETCKINKSISTLGKVINALSNATSNKNEHVPFRDSKLTRILTETLNGKAACVLVANISNTNDNIEENLMTLTFAQRAMSVRTKPKINEKSVKTTPVKKQCFSLSQQPRQQQQQQHKPLMTGVELAHHYKQQQHQQKQQEEENKQHSILVQKNNELEKEVNVLKRLLELKEASLEKCIQPPPCSYDLLELDLFEEEATATATATIGEGEGNVFTDEPEATAQSSQSDFFASSLYNKADKCLIDAADLKKQLLAAQKQQQQQQQNIDYYDQEDSIEGTSFEKIENEVNNFEEERAGFLATIEKLQKELALKNVVIAQLSLKLKKSGNITNDENSGAPGKKIRGGKQHNKRKSVKTPLRNVVNNNHR